MPDGQEQTIRHAELLGQLGWVQRLAQKIAGDANVAADVTQDVWLKTQGRKLGSEPGLQGSSQRGPTAQDHTVGEFDYRL